MQLSRWLLLVALLPAGLFAQTRPTDPTGGGGGGGAVITPPIAVLPGGGGGGINIGGGGINIGGGGNNTTTQPTIVVPAGAAAGATVTATVSLGQAGSTESGHLGCNLPVEHLRRAPHFGCPRLLHHLRR
jgi:hypothetical protein